MSQRRDLRQARRDLDQARRDLSQIRHHMRWAVTLEAEQLAQVVALEELAAARWPRRIIARRRLRADLRASIRHAEGDTFEDRRISALDGGWLERP